MQGESYQENFKIVKTLKRNMSRAFMKNTFSLCLTIVLEKGPRRSPLFGAGSKNKTLEKPITIIFATVVQKSQMKCFAVPSFRGRLYGYFQSGLKFQLVKPT